MKKFIVILLTSLFILAGCTAKPDPEIKPVKVMAPAGAPALSLINYVKDRGTDYVTVSQGADALQAELLNPNSEFDAIVAPINLGATLITKKGAEWSLAGVVTWGNLYLVCNEALKDSDKDVALFGESAVPGKVVGALDLKFTQNVKWYSAVSEASAALLSGDASYALLAEPVLTATLAKAKQNSLTVTVVSDLQEEFNKKYGTSGYPQAALFVSNKALKEKKGDIDELIRVISSLQAADVKTIEGNESFYGVPSAAVVEKAFSGMNVRYQAAKDCEKEIGAFLKLFGITDFTNIIVK